MATIDPRLLQAQPERTKKTRGGQKAGPKAVAVPLKPTEDEIPPAKPSPVPVAPKKRGRKPKQVAPKVDKLPSQEDAVGGNPEAASQPAGNTIGSATMKLVPVPTHDPLPVRKVRNTHPGLAEGVQPTPCRSSQEVAAERNRK